MNYLIRPNQTTKINEKTGTIQNTDQIGKIELSNSENFTHTILIYPYQKMAFNKIQLYARLFDNKDFPIELRVIPVIFDGGTISGGETEEGLKVITDEDFENMVNDVFNGNTVNDPDTDENFASSIDNILAGNTDPSPSTSSEGGTVNIDGNEYNVASDADFNSMLDDLGL